MGERRVTRSGWLLCLVAWVLPAAVAAAEIDTDIDSAFGGNAGVTVEGIRLGLHADKLRIVLDATGPLNFDYAISEGGKTIVVLIPQVRWVATDYLQLDPWNRIYAIRFFPSPAGGGVLSILGRERLGLSAVEQIGPGGGRPHRVVLDIPFREQDAWVPGGGIVRGGKLLPAHRDWPPAAQSLAGAPLPVVTRKSVAGQAEAERPVSYAKR